MGPGVHEGLAEAEVIGAGEELLCAIHTTRGEQFLGPEDPQRFTQFIADEVLSTFAASEREVPGLCSFAPTEEDQELGVLVVGVGADQQDPLVVPQHPQLLQQHRKPPGGGGLERTADLCGEGGGKEQDDQGQHAGTADHQGLHIGSARKIARLVHR